MIAFICILLIGVAGAWGALALLGWWTGRDLDADEKNCDRDEMGIV